MRKPRLLFYTLNRNPKVEGGKLKAKRYLLQIWLLVISFLFLYGCSANKNQEEGKVWFTFGQPLVEVGPNIKKIYSHFNQVIPQTDVEVQHDGESFNITYYEVGSNNRRLGTVFQIFDNFCGECGFECYEECNPESTPCPDCYPLSMLVGVNPNKTIHRIEILNPVGPDVEHVNLLQYKIQFNNKKLDEFENIRIDTLTGATQTGERIQKDLKSLLEMLNENDILKAADVPMDQDFDYSSQPQITVEPNPFSIGEVQTRSQTEVSIPITNTGQGVLNIERIQGT